MITPFVTCVSKFLGLATICSFSLLVLGLQMLMNVQVTMNATRPPCVQTQKVATRAAVLMVTREMEGTAQVNGCAQLF